jgi:hypothetical protein
MAAVWVRRIGPSRIPINHSELVAANVFRHTPRGTLRAVMNSFRKNHFAASAVFLCSGAVARLEAGRPLPDPRPLSGTVTLELGFTEERLEGRGNLIAPLFRATDNRDMLFIDGNWSGKGDANENASAGLGFRHRFVDPDIIVGINGFYDYGDYSGHGTHQFGVGFELLSKWFDFRANGYIPQESVQPFDRHSTSDSSSQQTTFTNVRRSSRTIFIDGGEGVIFQPPPADLLQTTTTTVTTKRTQKTDRQVRRTFERREGFMTGFDMELGGLVPYLDCWAETRIYAGYAFFDDPFGNDINCFTARLESRPLPAVVFDVQYKGDSRLVDYENHWIYSARVEIPFDLGNLLAGQSPFAGITDAFTPQGRCWGAGKNFERNRMNEQIIRNWRPTISRTGVEKVSDRTTVDQESTTTVNRVAQTVTTVLP